MSLPLWVFASLLLAAPSTKMALFGFNQGAGVDDTSFRAVIDSLAGEVRSNTTAQVITPDEIKTLLSAEEHKQMLGCSSESCFAEIGGALGADRILTGSIGKAGQSMMLVIKIVSTKRVGEVKQVSRRLKGGGIDEVLDAIPGAVKELFGAVSAPSAAAASPVQAPVAATPKVATASEPAFEREGSIKARPFANADNVRSRLKVFSDGSARFLALEPKTGSDTLVFFGGASGLYQQRIEGSSRNLDKIGLTFVDGRFRDGWQRGIEILGDVAVVQCGDQKVEYKLTTAKQAEPGLKAPLYQPWLTYREVALAADPTGVYYYVDRETGSRQDPPHRLFIGRKGKLAMIPVDDVLVSEKATSYITAKGRLVVGEKTTEWTEGAVVTKLEPANLYLKGAMIFSDFGAYPAALHTPCDSQ